MSPLRPALQDYLTIRRALGFKLERHGRLLPQFVASLERVGADTITTEHALRWATLPSAASPVWWADRLSVVRGFARYLQTVDPACELPPADLLPARGSRRATPYLYSDREIAALLLAAGALRPPLRAATTQTLIGLLAVTGMRIGEAIRLDRGDLERTPLLRGGRPARYPGSVAGERRRPAASCNAIALMAPPRRQPLSGASWSYGRRSSPYRVLYSVAFGGSTAQSCAHGRRSLRCRGPDAARSARRARGAGRAARRSAGRPERRAGPAGEAGIGKTALLEHAIESASDVRMLLNIKNKTHAVTAQFEVPDGGANGVLIAQGGAFGGWALYLHQGRPRYCYNLFGMVRFRVGGAEAVPPGEHQLRMEFAYDGGGPAEGGGVTLHLDGEQVAEGRVDGTVPMIFSADETADVGQDTGTTVSDDYSSEGSRFTGTIEWVQIDIDAGRRRRGPPHRPRGTAADRDGAAIATAAVQPAP